MRMHNPPHPGGVLLRQWIEPLGGVVLWIEPLGISITQAAKHLGVSRKALSELVHEHTGVS